MKTEKKIISVIVPVYQGKEFIAGFFEAWRNQSLDKDLVELVIADNNSSDGSYEMLYGLLQDHPELVVISYADKQSSYAARNAAVAKSTAPFLLFTDIDCVPKVNWLASAFSHTEANKQNALVAGKVSLFPCDVNFNVYEWFDSQSFLKTDQLAENRVAVTANLLVSRGLYDELEGFRELTSGSDIDFSKRAKAASCQFIYAPEMNVGHPARSTCFEISKKIDRVAKGKAEHIRFNQSFRIKSSFALKHIAALLVQHLFWKDMMTTWREKRFSWRWKFRYSFISLQFWIRYRIKILHELYK
mgnify:CR=1 FL=1